MAETFHQFPDLPTELRLKIWEQALIEARPDRRIILWRRRVVPFKKSISPLLLVNHESRTCATAFYNVKIDVYVVPALRDGRVRFLDKTTQWARIPGSDRAVDSKIHGYTDEWTRRYFFGLRNDMEHCVEGGERWEEFADPDIQEEKQQEINIREKEYSVNLEEHWSEFVEERLRVFGTYSALEAEKSGAPKGVFYISPEHDVFIDGYECGRHFHIENASELFEADLEYPQRPACRHVSAEITAATRERISTLVLVRPGGVPYATHCVFALNRKIDYQRQPFAYWGTRDYWKRMIFPGVHTYFILTSYSYTDADFLQTIIGASGAELSRRLEQWVLLRSSVNKRGEIVWHFEKAKGYGYSLRGPVEKADWVRDLMAHWNVGEVDRLRERLARCNISN